MGCRVDLSTCAVLSEQLGQHGSTIAPSTYYEAAGRAPSKRAVRDKDLEVQIARVRAANYDVYGPRKIWLQLNREGIPVARCTVERLMRELDLVGARRGKQVVTTRPDARAARPSHDRGPRRLCPRHQRRHQHASQLGGALGVAAIGTLYLSLATPPGVVHATHAYAITTAALGAIAAIAALTAHLATRHATPDRTAEVVTVPGACP